MSIPLNTYAAGLKTGTGFTLLEMLLAIGIFSMVSLSGWQMLNIVSQTRDAQLENQQRLHEIDYAFLLIKRDIQQLIDRAVRTGGRQPISGIKVNSVAGSTSQSLSFVRAGWHNTDSLLPRSNLQRVYYRINNGTFQRAYDHILDKPTSRLPEFRSLISHVKDLSFQFYYEGRWQDRLTQETYPQGLTIRLSIDNHGIVERRFLIPARSGNHDNG